MTDPVAQQYVPLLWGLDLIRTVSVAYRCYGDPCISWAGTVIADGRIVSLDSLSGRGVGRTTLRLCVQRDADLQRHAGSRLHMRSSSDKFRRRCLHMHVHRDARALVFTPTGSRVDPSEEKIRTALVLLTPPGHHARGVSAG